MTTSRALLSVIAASLVLGLNQAAEPAAPATPAADAVPAKNLLPDDADKAWKELVDSTRPPLPPAEWNQTKPSDEEYAAFKKKMGESAGGAADKAKEFYTRFKDHKQADQAKKIQREMLQAAVQLGVDGRRAELVALGEGEAEATSASVGLPPAAGPFEEKMQAAVMKARKLQDQGMEAVLADFEKSLREIQKEYPDRPEIYGSMMEIIQLRGADKAKDLVEEILKAEAAPKQVKAMVQGLKKKLELVGKPLSIQFTAVDGRKVDLAEMKGKVVLIDFWATWCGPCVAEIPNVLAAYEKLNPKGFEIVGISFDQDEDALKSFVKKKKMPWAQYFDGEGWKNKYGQEYGINGIPEMWLVDKKGNLVDMKGREDLAAKVEKLLAEN